MANTSRFTFYCDNRVPLNPEDAAPREPEPYIAPPGLVRAVNLAMHVGRPLLLEGEAGCGKTRLARAVAYELGLPLFVWQIRSTSKAQEGLYSYDAILRLHDVQIAQLGSGKIGNTQTSTATTEFRDPADPRDYRYLGSLGHAFAMTRSPAVVLIDEIDKADIDFPNDLLAVLDEPWEFQIQETGETIKAEQKPIVIITSNKEKGNLPFPFLRRCVYYFIEFPDEVTIKRIVEEHYKERESKPSAELIDAAASRFIQLRSDGNLHKSPSTSEFLDWVESLHNFAPATYDATELVRNEAIPYPSLLLKLRPDWQQYHST